MSNVHLPFVSVYQRMTDFVHTLGYASVICNSVTGLLKQVTGLLFATWYCESTLLNKDQNCALEMSDQWALIA